MKTGTGGYNTLGSCTYITRLGCKFLRDVYPLAALNAKG
jgi:hypothetical protein